MNKKPIAILIIVLCLVTALGTVTWFLFVRQSGTPADTQPPVTFPNASTTIPGASSGTSVVAIYGTDGSVITVPDFLSEKPSQQVSEDADDTQYDLTPYPEYVPGEPYPTHPFDAAFNTKNSEFLVTLNQEPIGEARQQAESFLREELALSNDQLCGLNSLVIVPYEVNPQYAAVNLGFSFCPGAVKLPR